MSFPKPVPESKLEAIRAQEQETVKRWEAANYDPKAHQAETVMKRHRQEQFLEIFRKCLSPKLACKQVGISVATYRKWRNTDSWFAEQLNEAMSDWREELLGSAVSRAIGYTAANPETGELITDASGKVKYFDGSDSLARALLNMDSDEQKKSGVNVIVNIDLAAAGFEDPKLAAETAEHFGKAAGAVVDAEFTEVKDSDDDD